MSAARDTTEKTAAGVAADITDDEQSYLHAAIASAAMSTALQPPLRMQARILVALLILFKLFLQQENGNNHPNGIICIIITVQTIDMCGDYIILRYMN